MHTIITHTLMEGYYYIDLYHNYLILFLLCLSFSVVVDISYILFIRLFRMPDLTPNSVPFLFLGRAKDEEHRVPHNINNCCDEENHPPMRNIAVTLYNIPRNVWSHEPHEVGGTVGDIVGSFIFIRRSSSIRG